MTNIRKFTPRSGADPAAGTAGPGDGATAAGMSSVEHILAELAAGRMVLILDDEDRENEGDLIMAAEHATPAAMAFMIRHSSGIICVPMEDERLRQLDLPQMVAANSDSYRTAFTVSVDYKHGTSTGVSATDRALTIQALARQSSQPQDFNRPGHIFPLRPRAGGVLVRAGHTEAAVDLCRLAGLTPAGVLCELMNDDGSMARLPQCEVFARQHNLAIGTIADLIRYRLRNERSVERIAEQTLATEFGEFHQTTFQDGPSQTTHLALWRGRLDGDEAPLVRVHVADPLRDALAVQGDRSWTLRRALEKVASEPNGVVVILNGQENHEGARGAAERGVLRTFGVGAQILKDLGVNRMRVLSSPMQMHGLSAFGLEVEAYVGADTDND